MSWTMYMYTAVSEYVPLSCCKSSQWGLCMCAPWPWYVSCWAWRELLTQQCASLYLAPTLVHITDAFHIHARVFHCHFVPPPT